MAIKCNREDCKFRDERGYCSLDYIEVNDQGVCEDFEKDEMKAIVEYNSRAGKLLTEILKSNLDENTKKLASFALILSMRTEDGEYVGEKLERDLNRKEADRDARA